MDIAPTTPPTASSVVQALEQSMEQAVAQVLDVAAKQLARGDIEQAEDLYRSVLQADPQHAEANYRLGRLAVQVNQPRAGLPFLAAALERQPECTAYWVGYIDALIDAGETASAAELLALAEQHGLDGEQLAQLSRRLDEHARTARLIEEARQPRAQAGARAGRSHGKGAARSVAHQNLREQARAARDLERLAALYNRRRFPEAEVLARTLTSRYPAHGFCWKMLGTVLQAQNRMDEALPALETAARLWPEDAETHSNLGVVLKALGRTAQAEACYERALQIAPGHAQTHNNLGILRRAQGRLIEAAVQYGRAIESNPDLAETHLNLGNVLSDLGRLADAETAYRRVLELAPAHLEAQIGLAGVLGDLGHPDEAEVCYRRVLEQEPALVRAHSKLGRLLHDQGRLAQAEACHRRALQLDPSCAVAHSNLASTLMAQARVAEAEAVLRQAVVLIPQDIGLRSALLFCLAHSDSVTAEQLYAEHRQFGEQVEAPVRHLWRPHANSRDPGRRLEVGIVSGDLRGHPVALLIAPLLELLGASEVLSLHAYSNNPAEDELSARLRSHVHRWHRVCGLSDAQLAEQIRSDGIDILVDLSGHTDKHRLQAFARRLAPIQVSWIGYPGTSGLASMDYYLADAHLLPPGQFDSQFSEKLVYLPACAPFVPVEDAPDVNELPALGNGYLTFGSFNRPNKIRRPVVALWAQLLRAVPDARLVLGGMPASSERHDLAAWFEEEGIAPTRLIFHPRCGMADYLALHHQVDVCLDTFPYNGGTTTMHALWMGVPTLTLAGATAPSRGGAGLMGYVDLHDFVAGDAASFVAQGAAWARRLPELAALRAGLRERFARSPAGQPSVIAAGVERAFRTMWTRWCAGLPPQSFDASQAPVEAQPLRSALPGPGAPHEPIFVTQPHLPPLTEFVPYLEQIWESKWLTNNGQFHQQLERALCDYLGVEHVALFSNGTLALVTALQALRISGEVITTPYSFVATGHSLLWNGIKPVFVDIDPATLNLDPRRIEAAITPQTTAIMPVHVYGHPCDVKAIERIADNYNLRVIYDAAHAFGVQDDGGSVLRHGDLSVLSFHATKVFNTFEGGAIVCPDAKTKQRIDHLKNFGFVDEVTVVASGINGKMSEVNAAFGLLQLRHIDDALARRRDIDALYRELLRDVKGISCVQGSGESVANHSYFPVLVEPDYPLSRDALYQKLRERNVHARRYFFPLISNFPMYRGQPSAAPANLPVATEVANKVLCLPIYPALERGQVEAIVRLVREA